MIVEKLTVEHFTKMRVQAAQQADARLLNDAAYQASLCGEGSYAAVTDTGETVAVGGLVDHGGGRALAWSWMSEGMPRAFLALFNAVRRGLNEAPFHRIEMHVNPDNFAATKFAHLLGFDFECPMRHYYADGKPAYLFARVGRHE